MATDLETFGERLSSVESTEVNLAVALLWYFDHEGDAEVSASKLATTIHDLSLRNKVNSSRLASKLQRHGDVVRGSKAGAFKLKLSRKSDLNEKYLPLLKRPRLKVEDHVLSSEDFRGTRRYLETLVRQINGCYQCGLYDGCAVLCRRLTETLLISAFEHAGEASAIKKNGHYVQLSDVLSVAKSGKHIKLSRNAPKDLDAIKAVGDTAAHHRNYITKPEDIDDIKLKLRRVVAELMELADIEPKAA